MLGSALLLAHLRHVSVYWTTELKFDKFAVSFMEALYWLQCLKQLKMLEVVISTPLAHGFEYYMSTRPQSRLILRNLRGLEKTTIKYDFAGFSQGKAERQIAELNVNEYSLKLKEKSIVLHHCPRYFISCWFLLQFFFLALLLPNKFL